MSNVPTNLIPTKITGLPEYVGSSQAGYFPYVLEGTTYKVQFSNVASAGEVPPSRTLTAGTGLVGGGDLSANRVFAIADGGVGTQQLDTTGVVAGAYGNASNIPTVTVDANGRVTSVTTSPVVATGYVPESRTITAGTGLIGGGSLANNITLSLNLSSATPQALGNATAGVSTAAARGDHVHPAVNLGDTNQTQGALPLGRGGTGDALSPVAGAVVYSTGTKFALTNPGIPGQVLTSTGTDEPLWTTLTGTGTVTSVNASGGTTGMTFTGGPITVAGTLTLGGTLATGSGGTGLTGTPTNGQLLIGNGTGYALSTLTAGTAVSITNAGEIPAGHQDGSLELALVARNYGLVPDPIGSLLQDFGPKGGDWGAMGWHSAQVSQTIAEMSQTVDLRRRSALRGSIATVLQAELPVIPVAWSVHSMTASTRLGGVSVDPLERSYRISRMRWVR